MEQISRKVNLRLKGIEVFRNDSPAIIMKKIKEELIVNNVDLPLSEIDRCHHKYYSCRGYLKLVLSVNSFPVLQYINKQQNFESYHLTQLFFCMLSNSEIKL